jgi:Fic family protein
MIKIKDVEMIAGLKNPNALSLVEKFEKAGILKEITGRKRNRVFAYREYISLFG